MTENQNPGEKQRPPAPAQKAAPGLIGVGSAFEKAMDELTGGRRTNTVREMTEQIRNTPINSPKGTLWERLLSPFTNWWWSTRDSVRVAGHKWREILHQARGSSIPPEDSSKLGAGKQTERASILARLDNLIAETEPAECKKPRVETTKPTPDFFTSIATASDYAGVSKRTILRWKERGWLQFEQGGQGIRIARDRLDKCRRRQPDIKSQLKLALSTGIQDVTEVEYLKQKLERLHTDWMEASQNANRWANRFIVACLLILILATIAYRQLPKVAIWPDEDSTTVLHYTRYHLFTHNEEFRLEARPDPEDDNRVKWMCQDKATGTWYPMPLFEDSP